MALVVKDRVQETTTTTGTGTLTLLGAVTGYQAFSVIGNTNTTYYTIASTSSEWEVGIGTYTASGTTLSRDTILSSSNAGSAVNLSAGTKNVFVTYPATRSVYANGTTLTATNSAILPTTSGGTGLTSFTTNGVMYASSTAALVTGSALTFDGTNLACTGTISSSSDETLKTNWRDLSTDFVEQLAKVKHGIYDRIDVDLAQVGVSAQSLRPIMEHAIIENEEGQLSVAYGNAALVACIQLAQRVVALEAKLEQLIKDRP